MLKKYTAVWLERKNMNVIFIISGTTCNSMGKDFRVQRLYINLYLFVIDRYID